MQKFNPLMATDSYKYSHAAVYPSGVTGMAAAITARTGGLDIIVPFGLQMFLMDYLSVPFTMMDIEEAEAFCKAHGEPFEKPLFESILYRYKGYWPVVIKAVPEGTPVPSGHALVSIVCTDPQAYWCVSFIETMLQRGEWFPTTIVSRGYAFKKKVKTLYEKAGADLAGLDFALQDFAARGVTSREQAIIGGIAHIVNFKGSDNVEAVRSAKYYYGADMAAFSVPASEHSVQCSYGSSIDEQAVYLRKMLTTYAKPGKIVSIVLDGYDLEREATTLALEFGPLIKASGAVVVFRPDSGDMFLNAKFLLKLFSKTFEEHTTSKGYKYFKEVKIIQGDGIDSESGIKLLNFVMDLGYSPDVMVEGSGGGLLQAVSRDTFRFAQKTTAIRINNKWVPTAKNPVTDPTKASKGGVLELFRSRVNGEFMTFDISNDAFVSDEWEPMMVTVFDHGEILNTTSLAEIILRCKM